MRDAACASAHRWAVGVVGRVLDESGAARVGVFGQACVALASGRRVCLAPSQTSSDGVFTVALRADMRCIDEVALRVFDQVGSSATLYAIAGGDAVDGVVYANGDLVMVRLAPARMLPPIGDTSAMREVILEDGAVLTLAPASIDATRYAALASRTLRGDEVAARSLGDGSTFDTLLALGPEAPLSGPTTLRMSTRLPAGTSVEIDALVGLYPATHGPASIGEGRWLPIATAIVTSEGTVETPMNEGPIALGWIGVRAR